MAVVISLNCHKPFTSSPHSQYPNFKTPSSRFSTKHRKHNSINFVPIKTLGHRHQILYKLSTEDSNSENVEEAESEVDNIGVKAALSMLNFYKREISPLIPKSCRYVPTCSEYSMEAYKKYGVVKGTVLTAWRLCRCNPLGGSGFDPPRWFGETSIPDSPEE
ncbi:UPF0161 protein At3g09310 [Castanea sativa]|uniref:UPF0161 protein At3g09310 n=1 Tax=Castanea sativa TaxID=21020 RepID=UPI003AE7080B